MVTYVLTASDVREVCNGVLDGARAIHKDNDIVLPAVTVAIAEVKAALAERACVNIDRIMEEK